MHVRPSLTDLRFADGRRVHPAMRRYLQRDAEAQEGPGIDLLALGASYFDQPDPRLAILGPPAVTRLMFELWRSDPRLQARFSLGTRCIAGPMHWR
jgi:hypothetical protein